ncbi:MAG: hypothetical protein HY672_02415 [Chloroflexi bacterium]|nr:hypothetical protein [Chloroflexota bacterium]
MLVIILGAREGRIADAMAEDVAFVLGEMNTASVSAGPIELGGKTLVRAADLPDLAFRTNSVSQESDKIAVVKEYLVLRERIDCILSRVEEAAKNGTDVQCQGKVLVDRVGGHGLLGVSEMLETLNGKDDEMAKRVYLSDYLGFWDQVQKVNYVVASMAQMSRTNAIPILGPLISAMHRSPIVYEGKVLIPGKDVSRWLNQFRAFDTDEGWRAQAEAVFCSFDDN